MDSATRVAKAKDYYARGKAALAAGQADSARLDYEHAVNLDKDNVDAIVSLANLLVEQGYMSNARMLMQYAIKRHPNDDRLLHFRAVRDTASVRYDSLLAAPNPPEETFRAAASEAIAVGLPPRASDIVARGLRLYPHSAALRALADTVRANGYP